MRTGRTTNSCPISWIGCNDVYGKKACYGKTVWRIRAIAVGRTMHYWNKRDLKVLYRRTARIRAVRRTSFTTKMKTIMFAHRARSFRLPRNFWTAVPRPGRRNIGQGNTYVLAVRSGVVVLVGRHRRRSSASPITGRNTKGT